MASRPFGLIYLVVERKGPIVNRVEPQTELSPILAVPEPSTSSGMRRIVPKIRKRKKNTVDPIADASGSPALSTGTDSGLVKTPKAIPITLEFLHHGIGAVATVPIELPGDSTCSERFCLGSSIVTVPPQFANDFKHD